jgi:hypothetical protein
MRVVATMKFCETRSKMMNDCIAGAKSGRRDC